MTGEEFNGHDRAAELDQFGYLVDTLSPEEMIAHDGLAPVYEAASKIAVSSHNGKIVTQPIEEFPDDLEPLVQRLLNRYKDEQGFITFPLLWLGHIEACVASGDGVSKYRLKRSVDSKSGQETTYFTSFPEDL